MPPEKYDKIESKTDSETTLPRTSDSLHSLLCSLLYHFYCGDVDDDDDDDFFRGKLYDGVYGVYGSREWRATPTPVCGSDGCPFFRISYGFPSSEAWLSWFPISEK